jgi:hypothetical protein
MATTEDQEALRLLKSIDGSLKKALNGASERVLGGGRDSPRREGGTGTEAGRALKAVASATRRVTNAADALSASLTGLNFEVRRTSSGLGTLGDRLEATAKKLAGLAAPDPRRPAPTRPVEATSAPAAPRRLAGILTGIAADVRKLEGRAASIEGMLAAAARTSPVSQPAPAVTVVAPQPAPAAAPVVNVAAPVTQGVAPPPPPAPPVMPATAAPPPGGQPTGLLARLGGLARGLATTIKGSGLAGAALTAVAQAAQVVAENYFRLARVGLGSIGSLQTLSLNALRAGMSLADYTELLSKNSLLANRVGSLDEFDKATQVAAGRLNQLGIFGREAREFSASLQNSAISLGVPVSQAASAASQQVEAYANLRKSVNATAEEFGAMVKTMSENRDVQTELAGLAPAERAGRMQQLTDLYTATRALGLSAQASQKLTDAMIAQRKETVKNRFETAGRLRQIGGFTGMSAQAEEAAQLSMKGKARSKEEDVRLAQLAADLTAGLETANQTGDLGDQNVVDKLREAISGLNVSNLAEAATPANLARQSGEQAQKEFGQEVGRFGQAVGHFMEAMKGIQASGFLGPITGVLSAAAVAFRGQLLGGLQGLLGGLGRGAGAVASGVGGAASAVAGGAARAVSAAGSAFSSAVSGAAGLVTRGLSATGSALVTGTAALMQGGFPALLSTLRTGFSGFLSGAAGLLRGGLSGLLPAVTGGARSLLSAAGPALSGAFASLGPVLKTVAKGAAWLTPLIDGIGELFTGNTAAALFEGDGVLDRAKGVILAGLRAIPAAITDAIDWVFGTNLTNKLDTVIAKVINAYDSFTLGIIDGIMGILPNWATNAGPGKALKAWRDSKAKDVEQSGKTLEKLEANQEATLSSIGEQNQKAAEAQQKRVEGTATKAQATQAKLDNVIYGNVVATDRLATEARAMVAGPAGQAPATPAMPAPPDRAKLAPPEPVNTAPQPADAQAGGQAAQRPTQPSEDRLAALVAAMTELLATAKAQLAAEEQLVGFAAAAASRRPAAVFPSTEATANRLLQA